MAGFRDRGLGTSGQRAIPHPAVTLVVEFGAGPLVVENAAGLQRGSLVAGLGLGSSRFSVRGEHFEVVQVRLSPLVAHAVLGSGGEVVPLEDVWGVGEVSRIRERLADATSWDDRFTLMDALLARRIEASRPVDAEVAWAWNRIVRGRGRVRVESLADEVGWSRKRLWARFVRQVGLPPKRAAKLVRFDQAVHRLVAGTSPARVAAEGGYADQSHLHRDVMAFTGLTPATVAAEPFLTVDDLAWPTQRPCS